MMPFAKSRAFLRAANAAQTQAGAAVSHLSTLRSTDQHEVTARNNVRMARMALLKALVTLEGVEDEITTVEAPSL